MNAKLVITDTHTGRSSDFPIVSPETRIGRLAGANDIVLNDGQVSREHAVIKLTNQALKVVDLDSANGTFFDGKRIREHELKSGDTITIGKYALRCEDLSGGLSIKYDNKQIGSTVVMRTPGLMASIVPEIDTQSFPGGPGEKSIVGYIEVLKKKAETLSRLYELNRILAADFSLEDIFKKVSEMVFRLTPAGRFFVLQRDLTTGELKTSAAEFRNPASAQNAEEIMLSKTVVDRVIADRVALLSFDAQADNRLVQARSIVMQGIRSVMCAPLLGRMGVLGVIYVDCQEQAKIFSEDDLDLLNAVASEASIAVDNAISHKRLVREELARAKYRRFMPPHVVDEILASPDSLNLGGKNSCVTILFSDVRGFTSMSESLPPESVLQILNKYFADMTPIVWEHRGLLDKYIGDGLMALFGAPTESEDSAGRAVLAAIAMQHQMSAVNQVLKESALPEISIGIGINTGTVTVGYMGSEERTDYTAIGDEVNLAARLEKQALGGQIIISRATLNAVGHQFPVRPSGSIMVKGKKSAVEIYEVLWTETLRPTRPTKV
ncbi:MAG: adenylate/guanylate cyclase domain-containing protein [Blastocatellia bacterium]